MGGKSGVIFRHGARYVVARMSIAVVYINCNCVTLATAYCAPTPLEGGANGYRRNVKNVVVFIKWHRVTPSMAVGFILAFSGAGFYRWNVKVGVVYQVVLCNAIYSVLFR